MTQDPTAPRREFLRNLGATIAGVALAASIGRVDANPAPPTATTITDGVNEFPTVKTGKIILTAQTQDEGLATPADVSPTDGELRIVKGADGKKSLQWYDASTGTWDGVQMGA